MSEWVGETVLEKKDRRSAARSRGERAREREIDVAREIGIIMCV